MPLTNNFKIIAGKYRRLQFSFINDKYLRPTPSRVRETLFNWLKFELNNKVVLDCFAGSGSLGFEAISRGAKKVVLIEKNPISAKKITDNITLLADQNIKVINNDIFKLTFNNIIFDLILLDPPFNKNLIDKAVNFLININCVNQQTKFYIESEFEFKKNLQLKILKQKKASNIFYCLAQIK